MRGTLVIIVTAVLGFFGYQYTVNGITPDMVWEPREPLGCPGVVEVGDVVEHITGNLNGWVTRCERAYLVVDLGDTVTTWVFEEVKELQR